MDNPATDKAELSESEAPPRACRLPLPSHRGNATDTSIAPLSPVLGRLERTVAHPSAPPRNAAPELIGAGWEGS